MKRKTKILLGTLATSAALAVSVYLILRAPAPVTADVSGQATDSSRFDAENAQAMRFLKIRNELERTDRLMTSLVIKGSCAGGRQPTWCADGVSRRPRPVLAVPAFVDRSDDSQAMRAAARRDREAFIEKYAHGRLGK